MRLARLMQERRRKRAFNRANAAYPLPLDEVKMPPDRYTIPGIVLALVLILVMLWLFGVL